MQLLSAYFQTTCSRDPTKAVICVSGRYRGRPGVPVHDPVLLRVPHDLPCTRHRRQQHPVEHLRAQHLHNVRLRVCRQDLAHGRRQADPQVHQCTIRNQWN